LALLRLATNHSKPSGSRVFLAKCEMYYAENGAVSCFGARKGVDLELFL
jgi:hypothetical protein